MKNCTVSSGNGMVFNFLTLRILTIILIKFAFFFQFSDFHCQYLSFLAPGGKKPHLGFANILQKSFYCP